MARRYNGFDSMTDEVILRAYANAGLDYATGLPIDDAAWLALYNENGLFRSDEQIALDSEPVDDLRSLLI